jgi:hypothetical protein
MIPAAAVYGILAGAQLLGGIISGKSGRKELSPEFLKQHFGAQAVTADTLEYFNRILNSPTGQNMLAQAVQRGSQFQNEVESRAAATGQGAGGGGSSGASIFGQAAAGSAAQHAAGDIRSDIWSQAFNAAQQGVQARMGAFMSGYANQGPTTGQVIGSTISGLADRTAGGLMAAGYGTTPAPAKTGAQPATPTSMNTLQPTQISQPSLSGGQPPARSMAQVDRSGQPRMRRFGGNTFSTIQPNSRFG